MTTAKTMPIDANAMRRTLLEVVRELARCEQLQQGTALQQASQKLGISRDPASEEALLTLWYDLFRTGHLSWGLNLSNPNPPFCHLTEQGRLTLQHLSRDPANPDGYTSHLMSVARVNSVATSYITEALTTYNSNCFKATAVLVGCAAESLVLEVRDDIVGRMHRSSVKLPKDIDDWRIKRVLGALDREFSAKINDMPKVLAENVQAYWPAFTQQIRSARNDVGHPISVDPVTPEAVHASLLIFPELARLANNILAWSSTHYI